MMLATASMRSAARSPLARRSVVAPVICPLLALVALAAVWVVVAVVAQETLFWRVVLQARETSEWRALLATCLLALVRVLRAMSGMSAAWCTISLPPRLAVAEEEVVAWPRAMSEWSAAWRVVLLLAEAREVAAWVASDPRRWLRISRTP